jgi:hypothetical protein
VAESSPELTGNLPVGNYNVKSELRMNANEPSMQNPESRDALRDTFAAAALQGLLASNFYDRFKPIWKLEEVKESIPRITANIAYEYAEAMLARREVSKP